MKGATKVVALKDLKPNPFRDFKVDPLDKKAIANLKKSIEEKGFWGGISCRQINGEIQIGCGHQRIEAAKDLGLKEGSVYIGDYDDAQMVEVYAIENATQRGNNSTAIAGSVAAAIQFLTRKVVNGTQPVDVNRLKVERKYFTTYGGPGRELIFNFLKSVPGITVNSIHDQLVNLKTSGDYDRLVKAVLIEEKENEFAREMFDKINGAKVDPSFDYAGVAKYLKNENQIRAFRDCVTGMGMKDILKLEDQAGLAKDLVERARTSGDINKGCRPEISAAFIHDNIREMMLDAKSKKRKLDKAKRDKLEKDNVQEKTKRLQRACARHIFGATTEMTKLMEHLKKNNLKFVPTGEFKSHFETFLRAATQFQKVYGSKW